MRLIHTGDLHLGKQINGYLLLSDQRYLLSQIVSIAEENRAEGILLAGDIYDRAVPPAEAVVVFDEFLSALIKRKMKVFMISGNHDSAERLSFAKDLLADSGLYIAGEFQGRPGKVTMTDDYGRLNIYLLPFARPAVMRYYGCQGASYRECVKETLEAADFNEKERNILLTHHFVAGEGTAVEESDSECPISAGGLDFVDFHCMEKFDYAALGHIHRAQKVGRNSIRYSGSPLKYSLSEVNHDKRVLFVDIKEKGRLIIKEIPLSPMRDMRAVKGTLSELIRDDVVTAANPEDYLYATLTDTDEISDPLGKLRCFYPNILKLVLEKNIRRESDIEKSGENVGNRSMIDIYEEFYKRVTDRELDEIRRNTMLQLIEESGEGMGI